MVSHQSAALQTSPEVIPRDDNGLANKPVQLSIIVPVFNEAGTLPELCRTLRDEMERLGKTWEVLFINDGSTDGSEQILSDFAEDPSYPFPSKLWPDRCRDGGVRFCPGRYSHPN
jgi:Glycosyl transferase family 2